jgi:hypothetical protein
MQHQDLTWDEAENELNDRASDEHDRRREEHIKLWADEWANNVRTGETK